jgi:hypothetical protein
MPSIASKLTRVELDAARTITTGTTRVQGIIASNGSAGAVTVEFIDNNGDEVLTIDVPAGDSNEFSAYWIADKGLIISTLGDSDVVVTVAHTSDGA